MEFVDAAVKRGNFYDLITALEYVDSSENYFANHLEFIRANCGKAKSAADSSKDRFICSAFVVACYAAVEIIDATAQVAYEPQHFSPAHLYRDPTFGWFLGYLVPAGGSVYGQMSRTRGGGSSRSSARLLAA